MLLVSQAYKAAMRRRIREASVHATVYFGMFDGSAANDAAPTWAPAEPYAGPENLLAGVEIGTSYAAFERRALRLDGAQRLLPHRSVEWRRQGYISQALADSGGAFSEPPYIDIAFSRPHSMVGLTLTFDAAYRPPAALVVTSWREGEQLSAQQVTEGIGHVLQGEFLLDEVDRIRITFQQAAPGARIHLQGLAFGIGYLYADDMLQSLTEKHAGSPVSLEIPASGLQFSLKNEAGRFAVDGQTALQRFLAQGQQATVDYKVETAQAAQELPGGVWMLDTWKVDGATATFSLVDEMERLNKSTYETAAFDGQAHTLYALAQNVLNDAGLPPERYYIDPALKDTSTPCPLPLVSHAAALQLIAGAGRARLYVSRQGVVTLERLIGKAAPEALSGTAQMPWSEVHTVLDGSGVRYAAFEPGFVRLDGSQLLAPGAGGYRAGEWTAREPAGALGGFAPNEVLVEFEDPTNVFSLLVDWGQEAPARAQLACRVNGAWSEAVEICPARTQEAYAVAWQHCDAVKLVQTEGRPGRRPRLRRVEAGALSDFELGDEEVFGGPKGALGPRLRDVVTAWTQLTAQEAASTLATQDNVMVGAGWLRVQHDLCLEPSFESEADVEMEQKHYAYVSYVRLLSAQQRTAARVVLTGRKVEQAQYPVTARANETGEDMQVENPLLGDRQAAQAAADWVRDYYAQRVTYEDEVRGFPELDLFDTIYLAGAPAMLTETELTYNGALRQKLKLRR